MNDIDSLLPNVSPHMYDEIIYFQDIVEEVMFDEAIEFMWLIRSGQMTLEELYNVQPLSTFFPLPKKGDSVARKELSHNSTNNNTSSWMNKTVVCQICKESVAGVRYAPHLERCMNGGKRGVRRHYEFLQDTSVSLPYYNSKPKQKKEFIDPFPESLVVKVRVKNGGVVGPHQRHGATLEEFETARSELSHAIEMGTWSENFRNFYLSNNSIQPTKKKK